MIVRLDWSDPIFFFRHSVEVAPVPLHFDAEELGSLSALEQFDEKGDLFRLMREASNASTFHTRLAMLTSALESIAGQKVSSKRKETNKEAIRTDILRDDKLYDELFAYGDGIRNQMLHGAKVSLKGDQQYIPKIHRAIVRFFNEHHGTSISTTVVNPMRFFMGNYEVLNVFLRARNGQMPRLKEIMEDAAEWRDHGGLPPAKYESVSQPESY